MGSFRTKARAVDLLGEKQIKDDATAISELFKNAHDADANDARIEIDTASNTLVVWDDGEGMSKIDVEEKWLTLGTSSKYSATPGEPKRTKLGRITMGEKGIGRLAIATLGPQTLMVTRRTDGGAGTYVLVYLHWGIFTNGELFLEETRVPIRELDLPTARPREVLQQIAAELPGMIAEFRANLVAPDGDLTRAWKKPGEEPLARRILEEIDEFRLEDRVLLEPLQTQYRRKQGTVFFVTHLKERWAAFRHPDQMVERLKKKRTALELMLGSFINSLAKFSREHDSVELAENIHPFRPALKLDGADLVLPAQFESDDLNTYDYALIGQMEGGVFRGQSLIRGQEPEVMEHELTHGIQFEEGVDCGAVEIRLYFVEGKPENSKLPAGLYKHITDKVDAIGGIYLYRDGLRVLPYGTAENDFLEIEKRRTLNAGRYLFSGRRVFGYLAISKKANPGLVDKSSREGLRETPEYEYFVQVLRNLLIWWGKEHLNEEGRRDKYKGAANQQHAAEKEQAEALHQLERARRGYQQQIERAVDQGISMVRQKAEKLSARIDQTMVVPILVEGEGTESAVLSYPKLDAALRTLEQQHQDVASEVENLGAGIVIQADDRFGQDQEVRDQIDRFYGELQRQRGALKERLDARWRVVDGRLRGRLHEFLARLAEELRTPSGSGVLSMMETDLLSAQQRVAEAKKLALAGVATQLSERKSTYQYILEKATLRLDALHDRLIQEAERTLGGIFDAAENRSLELAGISRLFNMVDYHGDRAALLEQWQEARGALHQDLTDSLGPSAHAMETITRRFAVPAVEEIGRWVSDDRMEDGLSLVSLLQNEVQSLEERLQQFRSLAAAGLAVEIVNHEFEEQFDLIHQLLRRRIMQQAMQQVPELVRLVDLIRQVEERHRLLSPLMRRPTLYRKRLSLKQVAEHMHEFFRGHVSLYNVSFETEEVEKDFFVHESEAILYPVLINLIHNALYWMLNQRKRILRLRAIRAEGALYVEDTGPGIDEARAERIFDLGYTTRPEGRGIGLYLAQDLLAGHDHTIEVVKDRAAKTLEGACFRIKFSDSSILPVEEIY